MGISPFSDSCDCEPKVPNPNPYRWTIKQEEDLDGLIIVSIHYPDCTTYGGDKILVYYSDDLANAKATCCIDPHFLEREPSPIARFPATVKGMEMARAFASVWKKTLI